MESRYAPATLTWVGDVDLNWNSSGGPNGTNWSGDALPQNNDTLVFAGAATGSLNNNTTAGNAYALQFTAGGYTITGNAISLSAPAATDVSDTSGNTINAPLTFVSGTAVDITAGNTTFGATVTGSGAGQSITKTGGGTLSITGLVTGVAASFNANGGTLLIDNTANSVTGASSLNVPTGGTATMAVAPGSSIGNAQINVTGGTLNLIAGANAFQPGLKQGLLGYPGGNIDQTTANPATATALSPFAGDNQNTWTIGATTYNWGDNQTWVYTGQFFDADGTFSFAEHIDDQVLIKIDGVQRLLNTTWNGQSTTGILNLTPGWHDIDIRIGNGNGGRGPTGPGNGGNGWTNTFGFGFNVNGSASADAANYVPFVDPGTGTLLRSPAASVPISNNMSVSGASTVNMVSGLSGGAVFNNLTMAAGTSLNVTASGTQELAFSGTTSLGGGVTVDTVGGAGFRLAGVVSETAAATVTKNGTGTMTLGGNNSYTGVTTVNNGVLVAGANNALGTAAAGTVVNNGGQLALRTATYSTAEALSLNGVGPSTGGALNSNATASFAGPITLAGNSYINSTAGTLTLSGGISTAGFETRIGGVGGTIVSTTGISGGGSLRKTEAGDLQLTAGNGFTNGTTIDAGRVFFNSTIGTNTIQINNTGTLDYNGGGALVLPNTVNIASGGNIASRAAQLTVNSVNLPTSGTLIINQDDQNTNTVVLAGNIPLSNNLTIQVGGPINGTTGNGGVARLDGLISNGFGITKTQVGVLHLNNASNSFTGNVAVNGGTLRVSQDGNALGTTAGSTTVASGATLEFNGAFNYTTLEPIFAAGAGMGGVGAINKTGGNGTISTPIVLTATSTIGSGTAGAKLTLSGALTVPVIGNVTFTGAGDIDVTQAFGNGNSPTTTNNVLEGRLILQTGFGINNTAGIAAALAATPTSTVSTSAAINYPQDSDGPISTLFGGQPGGNNFTAIFRGSFVATTTGQHAFANTGNDDTAVIWIDLDNNGVFSTTGANGNELIQSVGCCNATTVSTVNLNAGTYNILFAVEDTGGGSGIVSRFQDPPAPFPAATSLPIVNPSAQPGRFAVTVQPLTNVTKNGTGVVTLLGNNTYNGTTAINAGTLVFANAGAFGTSTSTINVLSGATLGLSGGVTLTRNVVANGPGATGQPGAIANISGVNTLSGNLDAAVVSAGTLGIGSTAGTLNVNGPVNMQFSQVVFGGAGDVVVNGALGGVGANQVGGGVDETIFNGTVGDPQTNIEIFRTTALGAADAKGILSGDLHYQDDAAVSARAAALGAVGFDNGDFAMLWVTTFKPNENGVWQFQFNDVDDNAGVWLDTTGVVGVFESTADRIYNRGCCGGSGVINTPSLVAGNSYLLGIVMNDGGGGGDFRTFQFKSPTAAGWGGGVFTTLNSTNFPNAFQTQLIANNALSKSGAGTVTLVGNKAYNGPTSVSAGVLNISGTVTSAVTVSGTGQLAGTGPSGAVSVTAATTSHSPGTAGPGLYTVNGNYVENGALNIQIATSGTVAGTDYDQVKVLTGGSVAFGAASTLSVTWTGAPGTFNPVNNQTFVLVDNDGTNPTDTTGNFVGLPSGSTVTVDGKNLTLLYGGGDGNDVVLFFTTAAIPTTVYIDDDFVSGSVDGNLETPAVEAATVGTDAFSSVGAVYAAYPAYNGVFVINGGTYGASTILGSGQVQLVKDMTNGENDISFASLTGTNTATEIETRFHNNAFGGALGGNLIVGAGSFSGKISGFGDLVKTGAGAFTIGGTAGAATLFTDPFNEVGGVVAVEAENYHARTDNGTHFWRNVPTEAASAGATFTNQIGTFMQAQGPDATRNAAGNQNLDPRLDFTVKINTAGVYRLFNRWTGWDGGSDSMYAQIIPLDGQADPGADWYRYGGNTSANFNTVPWHGDANDDEIATGTGGDAAATWTLQPGRYTVRFTFREENCAIDAFVLQLNSLAAPTGTGPTRSIKFPTGLGSTNDWTGATIVSAGTLVLAANNAIPDGSPVTVDGTLDISGHDETIGILQGASTGIITSSLAGAAALITNGTSATTYSGIIQNGSGTVSLVKNGSGVLTLQGASTYTGATRIQDGTLRIAGADNRLPTGSAVVLGSGAVGGILDLNGQNQTVAGITASGTGTNRVINSGGGTPNLTLSFATGTQTFAGILGNAGQDSFGIIKTGAGTQVLSGVNTYTGVTSVTGGTLALGNNSALGGFGSGTSVSGGGTLDFRGFRAGPDGQEPLTVSGTGVGGNGVLINTVNGANTFQTRNLTMTGAATFGGSQRWDMRDDGTDPVTFNQGGFVLTKVGGADLALVNTVVSNHANVNVNDGTFRVEGTTSYNAGSPITFTVAAGRTLDFWNTNIAHNANIVLNGGTLSVNNGNNTPSFTGTVTLNGANTIAVGNNSAGPTATISGRVTGTGSFTKTGGNQLTLSNNTNDYTGITTINAGIVNVTANNALGTTAGGTVVNSGGTIQFDGAFSYSPNEALTLSGLGANNVGALNKVNGSASITLPITTVGSSSFGSGTAGSTLTLPNALTTAVIGDITFTGAGNIDVMQPFGNGNTPTTSNALEARLVLATGFPLTSTAGIAAAIAATPVSSLLLTGAMNFPSDADATFSTFFGGQPGGNNFTAIFRGQFRSSAAGQYAFANTNNDDTAVIWIDLDGNGVFSTTGGSGNELIQTVACCNQNTVATVTLAANTTYNIAFAVEDTGGGSGIVGRFQDPPAPFPAATSLPIVNPSAMAGRFTFTVQPMTNVTKSGTGTVTFFGNNTYNGTTTVRGGTLVAANAASSSGGLGITSAGITVLSGGTLGLANGVNISGKNILLNGTGAAGQAGALANISGTNSYTGAITAAPLNGGVAGVGSTAGTLTVNGTFDQQYSQLVFNGAGNVVMNSTISGIGGSGVAGGITETIFNDGTAAAGDPQTNIEIFRNRTLVASDGRGVLVGDLNYVDDAAVSARAAALGAVGFDNGDFGMLWVTTFKPNESGVWQFQFANEDDNAAIWLDTTGTVGIFESTADRIYNRGCCGGSGVVNTPALVAGNSYLLGIVMNDTGGGGNFTNMQFKSPTAAGWTGGVFATVSASSYPFAFQVGGAVSNNSLVKNGTGSVTLGGNNTYNGVTTINAGTLIAAHANALGTTGAGTTIATNAALGFSGNVAVGAEPVTGGPNSILRNVSGTNTFAGDVVLQANIGTSTYVGLDIGAAGQRIEPGYLGVGTIANNAAGNQAAIALTSNTSDAFTVALNNVDQSNVTVGALDWRDRGDGTTNTLARLGEDQVKNNAGVVRVTLTSIPAGTYNATAWHLDASGTGQTQSGLVNVWVNTGTGFTLRTPPGTPGTGNYLAGFATLTTAQVDQSRSTFSFTADGTNDVIIVFDGRPFTADTETHVNGILLQQTFNLPGALTLDSAAGSSLTLNGVISDGGVNATVTKIGAGAIALANNNTYGGTTTISGGSLLAANSTGSATGPAAITVQSTGTLGGTGSVAGAVTVNSSGAIAPGTTAAGTLTTTSDTFSSGSSFNAEIGGTAAGAYDQLVVTGAIDLANATLSPSLIGGFTPANGNTFVIINKTSAGPITGTFNGIAEGGIVSGGGAAFTVSYNYDAATNTPGAGNDVAITAIVPTVQFSAPTFSASEGVGLTMTVTLTRSGDPTVIATTTSQVQISVTGGSATGGPSLASGADYLNDFPKTALFGAGATNSTFAITIFDDAFADIGENIVFTVSAVSNAVIGAQATTTFTIVDNDNNPPIANAGGPYSVNEGGSVTVSASGSSDPDGTIVLYEWDLDNNGSYEVTGISQTFNAGSIDGPVARTIGLRVRDNLGDTSTTTATVNVVNVAPTATLNNGGAVNEGSTGSVSFSGQFDPSSADTTATFHYAYDFDNNGTWEVGDGTYAGSPAASSQTVPASFLADGPGTRTVKARIIDKDNSGTNSTTDITINNVAPTFALPATVNLLPTDGGVFTLGNHPFTDPGADVWIGTVNYGDGSGTGPLSINQAAKTFSLSHPYIAGGTYTVTVFLDDQDGGTDTHTMTVNVPQPTQTYADDAWVGFTPGTVIPDADPVAAGAQQATFGYDAFATVSGAVTNVAANGTTTVNAGTYPETASVGSKVITVNFQEAAIQIDSFSSAAAATTLNISAGITLSLGAGSISSPVQGGGNLTKVGPGTLTFTGTSANTYTGTTRVNDGTLTLAKTGAQSLGGSIFIGDTIGGSANVKTAILRVNTSDQIADTAAITFMGDDGRLFIASGSETIANPTNLAQGNIKVGGTLTLTSAFTQTAGSSVTMAGGTLRIGSAGTEDYSLTGILQGSGTIYTKILTSTGTIDPSSGVTDADIGNFSPGRINIRGNLQLTGSSVTNLDVGGPSSDQLNVGINTALPLPAGSYADLSNYDLDPYLRGDAPAVTEPGRLGVNDLYNINGVVRLDGALNMRPVNGQTPSNTVTSMNFVWRAMNLPTGNLDSQTGANLSSVPSDFSSRNSFTAAGVPVAPNAAPGNMRFESRFMGSAGQANAIGQAVNFVVKTSLGADQAALSAPSYLVGQAKNLTLTPLTGTATSNPNLKMTKQLWNAMRDSHTRVTVTVTNSTGSTLTGPFYLEIASATGGTTAVFNQAGKTQANRPYLVIVPRDAAGNALTTLANGATATVEVDLLTPIVVGKSANLIATVLYGGLP